MFPPTTRRVKESTSEYWSEQIRQDTDARIAYYANSAPEQIDRRLEELDEEWDVERLIETESASMILMGVAVGAMVDRKWLVLPVFAATMLLLHNLHGWYPLLPLLRRWGIRTAEEIAYERYQLKAARGDFRPVDQETDTRAKSRRALESAWG